jgi:hypothetical protein
VNTVGWKVLATTLGVAFAYGGFVGLADPDLVYSLLALLLGILVIVFVAGLVELPHQRRLHEPGRAEHPRTVS